MSTTTNDAAYPKVLEDCERKLIGDRRKVAGMSAAGPAVGLALSGGGIRSATFCLGFLQALADKDLLKRFDYLSTVSGGGFIGSFLGALYSRGADAQEILKDNQAKPLRWLRENGRYLAPNGGGDYLIAITVILRNLATLHFVMGMLLLPLMMAILAVRAGAASVLAFLGCPPLPAPLSPVAALAAVPLALLAFPAMLYWLAPLAGQEKEKLVKNRRRMTDAGTMLLYLLLGLLGLAAIDTAGAFLYHLPWQASATPAAGIAIVPLLKQLLKLKGRAKAAADWALAHLPRELLIDAGGAALLLLYLGLWSALAYAAAEGLDYRPLDRGSLPGMAFITAIPALLALAVALFRAAVCFSSGPPLVSASSLQTMYTARLRRAYTGAANPMRLAARDRDISAIFDMDDVEMDDYRPYKHGGPLHLVNVTINETVAGEAGTARADRRGVPMAFGPAGISVGVSHHATWCDPGNPGDGGDDPPRKGLRPSTAPQSDTTTPIRAKLAALVRDREDLRKAWWNPFAAWQAVKALRHAWQEIGKVATAETQAAPAFNVFEWGLNNECIKAEVPTLAQAAGISGAAFSTGIGRYGRFGLSVGAFLFNLRMGHWWDSGVHPLLRADSQARGTRYSTLAAMALGWCFPCHAYLLNELLGRFYGTAKRHWNLSDGGHFDNTGVYELLRRRLPLIVLCDCGAEAPDRFDEVQRLIQKARIDFGADITFDPPGNDPAVALVPALGEAPPPAPGAPPVWNPAHAALATITYKNGESGSLLIVKPALTGDEPLDLRTYKAVNPAYPHESTGDQFFGEEQWECYRALGEHSGMEVAASIQALLDTIALASVSAASTRTAGRRGSAKR